MNKIIPLIFSSLALIGSANAAVTTPLKATADLTSMCHVSVQNVTFGALIPGSTGNQVPFQIQVKCNRGSPYYLGLHYPEFAAGSHLKGINSGFRLDYAIRNVALGTNIEINGPYSNGVNSTGTGSDKAHNFIAIIGKMPYVTPDIYEGTIEVRLTY